MKYYAGIDLGGTFVKCGILDENGNLLVKDKIPTGAERPYGEVARDMAEFALRLAKKAGVTLYAAGIGSPGTVDSANGVIVYSNNIRWENVPIGRTVGELLKIPVSVTNDANAAALGESYAGAGRKLKNIVLLTLGTGVGGGIVLDGKLFEGGRSAGTEIGHTVIRMNGLRCTCGRRGCLEAYASATALVRQTKETMIRHPESAMWKLCGGNTDNVDGKTSFDGALAGDKAAKNVVNRYIGYLAEGVADICNVFRPDAVLLGGGVSAQDEKLLKPLRRKVDKMMFGGTKYAPVKILTAILGNDAGLYGAARLAMIDGGRKKYCD